MGIQINKNSLNMNILWNGKTVKLLRFPCKIYCLSIVFKRRTLFLIIRKTHYKLIRKTLYKFVRKNNKKVNFWRMHEKKTGYHLVHTIFWTMYIKKLRKFMKINNNWKVFDDELIFKLSGILEYGYSQMLSWHPFYLSQLS